MGHKIGVLLPKSVIYPSINFDLVAGIRFGLAGKGITGLEIKTENIGVGGNDKSIYALCEKILMEGITIVAGYVNPATAEKLETLFESANGLFICLDAGYQFPATLKKPSHVFYISLQGALCCRMVTKIAMEDGMKRMAYAGSFYEAGYRAAFAFSKCLEEEGGSITFNHITLLNRADFTLAPLVAHLDTEPVDAVFSSFCGDMLHDFYSAAGRDKVFNHHPVYGAPFMAEEQWLEKTPYPGVNIKTCVPWARGLHNAENRNFTAQLSGNKQRVNVFSLLGWEASFLIEAALGSDTGDAISGLEGFSFQSPRGEAHVDADTHQCCAPVYDALVQKNQTTGNCILAPGKASPNTEDQRRKLENDIRTRSGPFTSWLNAYACLDS